MNLKKNFCQWYYQYHDRSRPADKRRPDNNRQTIVYSNFIGFAKGNQHTYLRLTSSVFLQVVVLSLWLFIGAKSIMKKIKNCGKRKGIRDIWWNAFFVKDCRSWDEGDIPECPTAKLEIPADLVTWVEAVRIHNKMRKQNENYKYDAYICFYCDDWLFDGPRGIWNAYNKAIEIIRHFAGIITPDFSTYRDFPTPLKAWNIYRMRAFGFWCSTQGINVINNVRWSPDTLDICFKGIPKNSVVCLGVVASDIRKSANWPEYEKYLKLMVQELRPRIILVYGSARYKFFKDLQNQGIVVKSYQAARNRKKAPAGDCHE